MELHVPAPSSSDGTYGLEEAPPTPPLPGPPDPEVVASSPPAEAPVDSPKAAEAEKPVPKPKKKRRRRSNPIQTSASWAVSVVVHVAVLAILGLATFSSEVRKAVANINSALVATPGASEEMIHVLADPTAQRATQAVGSEGSPNAGSSEGGGGGLGGVGSGPPSATPKVAGVGRGIGKGDGLPGVKVVANVSGLNLMPSASKLGVDLGGGGMIGGDVTYEAKDVGVALDQMAREILRHLSQHKLTVVWLFDESESMKDDQKAIREKFDRVANELKVNLDESKKQAAALNHAIVGFGEGIHYELKKPTANIDQIGEAIDRLKIDSSGTENTMHAIQDVVASYSGMISKDRRLLIVLVTDESGDDGEFVEEAHQAVMSMKVPIYVIGRQSLFGFSRVRLRYVDPVTKDVYWPLIRRGPETAEVEQLQWDGLHDRWDEQPSGFAPYELARLAKDTGGIYFLLPSEENLRNIRDREQLYSMKTLKEYVPDYEGRGAYIDRRNRSDFRRTMYDVILATRNFPFRIHFPIMPDEMKAAANEAGIRASAELTELVAIQKKLESLKKLRDREPDKRWQAHFDLMLAQIVVYQIKAYEYRACMADMIKTVPKPKKMPTPDLIVEWDIHHSKQRLAPKEETDEKYAEAGKLLAKVIELHPNTPWADLAKDEINRGFGVGRGEWHHNPKYAERAKLVPKY